MSDLYPLSKKDFERVEYWDDQRWDENGEQIFDGTCLPLEAHLLELFGWQEGPQTRLLCPEEDLGGCAVNHDGKRQSCYMNDWYSNLGEEMLDPSLLTIQLTITQGEILGDGGFTIILTGVAAWEAGESK